MTTTYEPIGLNPPEPKPKPKTPLVVVIIAVAGLVALAAVAIGTLTNHSGVQTGLPVDGSSVVHVQDNFMADLHKTLNTLEETQVIPGIDWPQWAQGTCDFAQDAKTMGFGQPGSPSIATYVEARWIDGLNAAGANDAQRADALGVFHKVAPAAYKNYCSWLGLGG